MNPIRVIIENWQSASWYTEWIPIIIAVIALITSLVSLYWTRQEFIRNTRPFVWASSYGVINPEKNSIIPVPHKIGFRVKNSPAKISEQKIQINLDDILLFVENTKNFVRFPDETSEWSFGFGKDTFENIMNRPQEQQAKLKRKISIRYSALDGRKKYYYELEQTYNPLENQWFDYDVIAN